MRRRESGRRHRGPIFRWPPVVCPLRSPRPSQICSRAKTSIRFGSSRPSFRLARAPWTEMTSKTAISRWCARAAGLRRRSSAAWRSPRWRMTRIRCGRQITNSVGAFLHGLWIQGALFGSTPKHAYFVHCDATTNSAADIAAHRVNVLYGAAYLTPDEFYLDELSAQTFDSARTPRSRRCRRTTSAATCSSRSRRKRASTTRSSPPPIWRLRRGWAC